jgi:hypothetical protein
VKLRHGEFSFCEKCNRLVVGPVALPGYDCLACVRAARVEPFERALAEIAALEAAS